MIPIPNGAFKGRANTDNFPFGGTSISFFPDLQSHSEFHYLPLSSFPVLW